MRLQVAFVLQKCYTNSGLIGINKVIRSRLSKIWREDMIRVLHFVSIPAVWSGVMNVIMNYYRMIDRDQIQFEFLCFIRCDREESYEEEIRHLGGQVNYIEKPGSSWSSVKQIQEFFKKYADRYTWLHNHEVYLSFFLKPLAAKYGLRNFIVHCHATQYSDHRLAALRNQILCIPISWMKCSRFACSEEAGYFLYGKKQMKAGNVFVMQNAIHLEKYRFDEVKRKKLRHQYGVDNCFVLGHIGRMECQKNHAFLLRVFQEVYQYIPNSRLVLVGDGSLREALEYRAEQYGIKDAVLFLGNRGDVPDLLQMMDLFLLPSLFEGVGVVLLEAQANGLSCIASDQVPHSVSITVDIESNGFEKNGVIFKPVLDDTSDLIREKQEQKIKNVDVTMEEAIHEWVKEIIYISNTNKSGIRRNLNLPKSMEHSQYNIQNAVQELEYQYQT